MKARVSIIQFRPELGDPAKNTGHLDKRIDESMGSHLIVLPELSNSGYNFADVRQAASVAETLNGQGVFQRFIAGKAKKLNTFIVSGICEKDGDNLYNSAILAGPEGIIGSYRKMHLFMNEKDIFRPGNSDLQIFNAGSLRIGLMICFDYLFPEPWGILARKGADIICHPSNLLTGNPHKCMPGLALMNRIYIATANRIGTEGPLTFNGRSFFTDPAGNVPVIASPDQEETISMDIDTNISSDKMITSRNHVFYDRRPEMYAG